MKASFLISIYVYVFVCKCFSQDTSGPLQIKYVNFRTTTTISVPCQMFDSSFHASSFKSWQAIEKEDYAFLNIYVKSFKKIKKQNVDVRAKIIYYVDAHRNKLCMDQFGVFTDGNFCYKNKALFDFLKRKTNQ